MNHLCKLLTAMIIINFAVNIPLFSENLNINTDAGKSDNQLTLDEFIKRGCSSNPEFRKIIIDRLYLEYEDDLNLDLGEIVAEFETAYLYSLDTDKDGITGSFSLSRLFPETATDITGTYSSSPGNTERSSSLNFRISQEIAENSFGKKWRLEKESLDYEKEIILYRTAEAYEDYLYYLVTLYYNWISSWRELKTAENSYHESLKLYENIKSRMENRIADQDDVNRSELQLLSKMEAVSSAENKHDKNSITLYDAAGLSPDSSIVPSDKETGFDYSDKNVFEKSSISRESRTFRILDLMHELGLKNIEIGKNSLLPRVSLFASYSMSGTEYNLAEERERVLSVGISLTEIGKSRKESASLETAEIDLERNRLENMITEKDLELKMREFSKDIENRIKLAEIYEKKQKLAEKILEEENKNYRIGRSDLSSLIDAANILDLNRRKKLDYESELNILIAGWLNLTDSLVRERISGSGDFDTSF